MSVVNVHLFVYVVAPGTVFPHGYVIGCPIHKGKKLMATAYGGQADTPRGKRHSAQNKEVEASLSG
jgi:hypothetical protein